MITPTDTRKCYFLSDLHLFSPRSLAAGHADQILAAVSGAELFILGGDIFDFHWTTLPSVERTVEAAIDWLTYLIEPHPDCQFYFILGNHDSHPLFTARLAELAGTMPHLSWNHYLVRLGDSVFLHGDVANVRRGCHVRLARYRARWSGNDKRGPAMNRLYDAAVTVRLHRLTGSLAYPRRRIARRLSRYLAHRGHAPATGLHHVYFGHTHTPMLHYRYRGLSFHNGGASIRGLRFRILEAHITAHASASPTTLACRSA